MAAQALRQVLSLLLATAALAVLPGSASGQVQWAEQVRLQGRIQWVTASKMVIMTDCGLLERDCNPISVAIDLTRVPLHEYRGLRSGDWVLIDGVVAHRNGQHWVLARSVVKLEEMESP